MLGFSGLRRNVLPHESSLSTLWYIAWRNALRTVDLYAYVGKDGEPKQHQSFQCPSIWIDGQKVAALFGITLLNAEEENYIHGSIPCPGGWISNTLRICPICLEHGYHSYWYQLHDLYECPIHQCRITGNCQSCGAPLAWYGFSSKLFKNSYYCFVCGKALSGTEPHWDYFKEFREHSAELIKRFAPLRQWAFEKEEKCLGLCYASKSMDGAYWCSHEAMTREPGRICHPVPGSEFSSSSGGIEIIKWSVQMMDTSHIPSYMRNTQKIRPVWAAFVRRMIYWIFGSINNPRIIESEREFRWGSDTGPIKGYALSDRELAFWILTYDSGVFVSFGRELVRDWTRPMWEIEIDRKEGRIPRVGLMYGLLGLYAGLLLTIRKLVRESDTVNLRSVRSLKQYWIKYSSNHRRNGWSVGAFAFPRIEGLPIRWSASIKRAYIEEWLPVVTP